MRTKLIHPLLASLVSLSWLLSACTAPPAAIPTQAPTDIPATIPQQPAAASIPMLKPGDSLGDLIVKKGPAAEPGPPIWAFCSPAFSDEPGENIVECSLPPLPELEVGHGWFSIDEATCDANWQAMSWELYLDGEQIDLQAFGNYDDDLPMKGLPGHSPDEEVITKLRTWNVILAGLQPGEHSLRSIVVIDQNIDTGFHTNAPGKYELVVNFKVEIPPAETPAP